MQAMQHESTSSVAEGALGNLGDFLSSLSEHLPCLCHRHQMLGDMHSSCIRAARGRNLRVLLLCHSPTLAVRLSRASDVQSKSSSEALQAERKSTACGAHRIRQPHRKVGSLWLKRHTNIEQFRCDTREDCSSACSCARNCSRFGPNNSSCIEHTVCIIPDCAVRCAPIPTTQRCDCTEPRATITRSALVGGALTRSFMKPKKPGFSFSVEARRGITVALVANEYPRVWLTDLRTRGAACITWKAGRQEAHTYSGMRGCRKRQTGDAVAPSQPLPTCCGLWHTPKRTRGCTRLRVRTSASRSPLL